MAVSGRRPEVTAGTRGTDAGGERAQLSQRERAELFRRKKHPLHEVLRPRLLSEHVVVIVGAWGVGESTPRVSRTDVKVN